MACLGIQFSSAAQACSRCGRRIAPGGGPALYLAGSSTPVCRECGKTEAPSLAALLALAQVAERVGRIRRYTLVPPMEALLELAGAAENYASSTAPLERAPSDERASGTIPRPADLARTRRAALAVKS
jgi:hypothetical protein